MPENCCNLPKIQTKRPKLGVLPQNNANGIANSEDPDLIRLLLEEQSDLGLYCLSRPICPKTKDHYGIYCHFNTLSLVKFSMISVMYRYEWFVLYKLAKIS